MSLRRRLTIVVAAAVAVAIAMAALVAYLGTRAELRGQIDDRLQTQADAIAEQGPPPGSPGAEDDGPGDGLPPAPPGDNPGPPVGGQIVGPGGDILFQAGDVPVPPASEDLPPGFSDREISGQHVRVLASDLPDGPSLRLVSSLDGVDSALAELRTVLFLLVAAGGAIAAFGARAFANRLLKPVASLTAAADHVSETQDLSRRIDVNGDDELAGLADRFNAMLSRLEASRAELDDAHEDQQRLIADASHELRTPVTALRTNIEVLASGGLDQAEAARALEAAAAQAEELGVLIGDLMDLARGEAPSFEREELRLDELASEAVERARRHAPGAQIALASEPFVVTGSRERLARAINNLLDNAVEHGAGSPIELTVAERMVVVRDHGPGIDPEIAERVFDRFYRGHDARRRPGSGLGLAIVKQIAEAHGGSVTARPASGGGTEFVISFG